jgi:hypothetical protein
MRSCACWAISVSLVPGQRAAQLLGQGCDRGGDRVADGFGAVPGECRPVLCPWLPAVAVHTRQVQQHREARAPLDQSADRRAAQAEDEIALPVAGESAVCGLGGPLADQDLVADEALASLSAGSWHPQRPPGA